MLFPKNFAKHFMTRLGLTWLTIFFLTTSFSSFGQSYLEADALAGEGIYAILRRFKLVDYGCNFQEFYKLNKLKRGAFLREGKAYKLPILVYDFNGKTIRSSIGIDDYDQALRIQHYNEDMLSDEMRASSFKKDKQLWVPFHELNCLDELLTLSEDDDEEENSDAKDKEEPEEEELIEDIPPVPTASPNNVPKNSSRVFPIFGDKHAYTPLQSNRLRGKVFYVVAGHGGPDPGAVGRRSGHRLCEDEYAYDVALRLCRNLIAHGATAYMINRDKGDGIRNESFLKCDTDEVLWGDVKMVRHHKTRLFQRSDIVNELFDKHRWQGVQTQIAIMIHVDSRQGKERTDLYFYHHPDSRKSRNVAEVLRKTMIAKYNQYQKNRQYTGTVTARDLHMLREIKPLSVYVELANILNSVDQQRIVLAKNRQYLADWLFAGILNLK